MNNSMVIAVQDIRRHIAAKDTEPIEDRLKISMREAMGHWLVTSEEERFKVAIGAVLLGASEEEQETINQELKLLRALSAASNGIPVDLARMFETADVEKTIGLLRIWDEVKKE